MSLFNALSLTLAFWLKSNCSNSYFSSLLTQAPPHTLLLREPRAPVSRRTSWSARPPSPRNVRGHPNLTVYATPGFVPLQTFKKPFSRCLINFTLSNFKLSYLFFYCCGLSFYRPGRLAPGGSLHSSFGSHPYVLPSYNSLSCTHTGEATLYTLSLHSSTHIKHAKEIVTTHTPHHGVLSRHSQGFTVPSYLLPTMTTFLTLSPLLRHSFPFRFTKSVPLPSKVGDLPFRWSS